MQNAMVLKPWHFALETGFLQFRICVQGGAMYFAPS